MQHTFLPSLAGQVGNTIALRVNHEGLPLQEALHLAGLQPLHEHARCHNARKAVLRQHQLTGAVLAQQVAAQLLTALQTTGQPSVFTQ